MSTITLPNIRVSSDLTVKVRLKDSGVAIDWSTLNNVKASIYSDAQRALAGRCDVSIDAEDPTLLVCQYAANKPQYVGVNRIVVSAKYHGETKTYDKPAFSFVRWTGDQAGEQITIDDPDVDVEIDVEDVSSSVLDEAIRAAFAGAERANDAADSLAGVEADVEAAEALRVAAEESRVEAEEDRVEAEAARVDEEAVRVSAEDARVVAENAREAAEDLREGAEDDRAAAETARETAEAARVAAEALRVSAEGSRESAEAARAAQASADHTVAAGDHTQAAADHTQAAADHTTAASDHTQASSDHTQAAADHTTAAADHTQAQADHAVMEGYDDRLDSVESEVSQLEAKVDDLFQDQNGEILYICDPFGHIIAKIDADGIHTTEMEAGDLKMSDLKAAKEISTLYDKDLYITDANGNVIFQLNKDGILATSIRARNVMKNPWGGKVLATYGDSITASTGGDFDYPYDQQLVGKWGNIVGKYFDFAKHHGRGIGSTCAIYRPSGGQVAWCKTDTGVYVGRNDSYTYDNYTGTIPDGCTKVRGDGSSWLRITTMFPASIKDTIDTVLVMFHNDYHQDMDTDVVWVNASTTDPEWAASTQYQALGGDYNISESVKAGFASIVMKLQAWMPQARIVLMTPISGVYASSGAVDGNFDNTQSALMLKLAKCVKDVAERMSIPCIDNYGNDGINSLNRTRYIGDNIHPNNDGNLRLAQSVIGGLSHIIPNLTY